MTGRRWLPFVALALAVSAISFAAVFFKQTFPTPASVSAGFRLLIAASLLGPVALVARRRGPATRPAFPWGAALIGGVCYALHFGAWVTSLELTSVAASVTLVTATPILLAVVSLLSGRDRPSKRLWAALVVCCLGLVVVGWSDLSLAGDALLGDGLALLGAAAMAAYMLNARRLGGSFDPLVFSAVATLVGGVMLLAYAGVMEESVWPQSEQAWMYILLAALVPQLIGHTLITWVLRHLSPVIVSIAVLAEPVGASVLGWLWLGEVPGMAVLVGCGVTLIGIFAATVDAAAKKVDATESREEGE